MEMNIIGIMGDVINKSQQDLAIYLYILVKRSNH